MTRSLRAWLVFFLCAVVPSTGVLLVVFRAASAERARVREDQQEQRIAAATALAREVETVVARARTDLRALSSDLAKDPVVAELERSRAGIADVVVIGGNGELLAPAPRHSIGEPPASAESVAARTALATPQRIAARERIVAGCVGLRSETGRYLWPLLALETDASDAMATWIETHAERLGSGERRVLAERVASAMPAGAVRARALVALERSASLHQSLGALLGDPAANDTVEAGIRTHRGRALILTRPFGSGFVGGYAIHAESVARAALPARLALVPRANGAPGDATDVVVAPSLVLRVVERDPAAAAARALWLGDRLAIFGAVTVSVAAALAALLFARALRAQRLAELRTDFVAAVSHELRTPLASVRMFAELLERGDVPGDERPEVERALAVESRRLSSTLERMLRFGALSRGKLGIEKERVALRAIAVDAASRFRLAHPDREVVVEGASDLEAHADPGLLGLALDNLLSNAAKYAPGGAPYRVAVEAKGNDVIVRVTDRGPGLDANSKVRVFLPFERADDRLSRATEGTGVGLALVRGIARAHGGDATVESSPGRGASFVVRFPKEQD